MLNAKRSGTAATDQFTELVYELLDAHDDTVGLASELEGDPRWDVHLAYLRDLQRVGRETLARLAVAEA